MQRLQCVSTRCGLLLQVFCLHGGLSPTMDTLDHIRALDRVQEVSLGVPAVTCGCLSPQSAGLALRVQLTAQEVGLGSQQWPSAGLGASKRRYCCLCS